MWTDPGWFIYQLELGAGGGGKGGLNRGFTVILSTASIILFLELLPGNEWGRGCGNQLKL